MNENSLSNPIKINHLIDNFSVEKKLIKLIIKTFIIKIEIV